MKREVSDLYINRLSATVVTVIKMLEGGIAIYLLFHLLRNIALFFTGLTGAAVGLNQMIQAFTEEYAYSGIAADQYSQAIAGLFAIPAIISGGIVIILGIGLILVSLEAIAIFILRFAKGGAGMIKLIHRLYMCGLIVHLILYVYAVYEYIRKRPDLKELLKGAESSFAAIEMLMIVVGVITLVHLLLHFFYHKDIALAMNTVAYETATGETGDLKRTHLSGISFLLGVPDAILFLSMMVLGINGRISASTGGNPRGVWVLAAVALIMFFKQLGVCFCNRNLKWAR